MEPFTVVRVGDTEFQVENDVAAHYAELKAKYSNNHGYLTAIWHPEPGRTLTEPVHRFTLGCVKGDGRLVDHVDHCTTNNLRANLRLVTRSGNNRNHGASSSATGYFGVRKDGTSYYARFNGKHLGSYKSVEEAAYHYDLAVRERNSAMGADEVPFKLNGIEKPAGFKRKTVRGPRALPRGVCQRGPSYTVKVRSKRYGSYRSLEVAMRVATAVYAKLEEEKQRKRAARTPTRLADGTLYLTTSCGKQVLLPSTLADEEWRKLTDVKWCMVGGQAYNTKLKQLSRHLAGFEIPANRLFLPRHGRLLDLRDLHEWEPLHITDPKRFLHTKKPRGKSRYVGVCSMRTRWRAHALIQGQQYSGYYTTEREAAVAYNRLHNQSYPGWALPEANRGVAEDDSVPSMRRVGH